MTTCTKQVPQTLAFLTVPESVERQRGVIRPRHTARPAAPQSVPVPGIARRIEVKLASEHDEWDQAYQLLAANYQARGYESPSSKLVRFTPYHALPDTATFVAKEDGQVVATLSVVVDNTLLGLPSETIYGPEIAALRRAGRHLSEATSLADRNLGMREFIQVFVTLIRLAMQYGVKQGSETWLITVNPRHRNFYCKAMGFVPLGPCRPCPSVQDHPAEAYMLDDGLMRANAPKMRQQIFGEPLPAPVLKAVPMTPDLIRGFASQSTQTDRQTIDRILRFVNQFGNPRRWP
jgi:hypothetical protein